MSLSSISQCVASRKPPAAGAWAHHLYYDGGGKVSKSFETIGRLAKSEGRNNAGCEKHNDRAETRIQTEIRTFMNSDTLGLCIPIIAITLGLGTGMLRMSLNYRKRKDMFALYHEERMAAIEKGVELPPLPEDFFNEDRKLNDFLYEQANQSRRASHGTLLMGLILLFVGLTLWLALHFTVTREDSGGDVALFGLIPAGVGAAFLIYYFTVGRKLAAEMDAERKARLAEAARLRNPPA
jgi:hypothetical protein